MSPKDAKAFEAKDLAEKMMPSLLSPVSSSCSSVISANIEFSDAKRTGANNAVTPLLTIRTINKLVEPAVGNQLTSSSVSTMGVLILMMINKAHPTSVGFLSKRLVRTGTRKMENDRPTSPKPGFGNSCLFS